MTNQASLLQDLEVGRKEIKTDSYSMSIGEIINLYKDGDLELNPAYQRLFRWDDEQKTRFVESILLGIPLPPIFVAQKEGGQWSIVDGLQRVSTILQLIGALPGKPPLTMTTAKKLPALEGLHWSTLPREVQTILKRSKLGINIISTENNIQAQYELFQRLNTGGIHLEPQEIRNCLIIMLSEPFYNTINELKLHPSFIKSLQLQETKTEIEFHMELILRYFIAKHYKFVDRAYNPSLIISEFIDTETVELINDPTFILTDEADIFKRTFDYIYKCLGKEAFKKYNIQKLEFEGPFSLQSYEVIVSGIATDIDHYEIMSCDELIAKVKNLYSEADFLTYSRRGTKPLTRFKGLVDLSRQYFGNL